MPGPKRTDPVFLETPRGLFTPAGTWFHTTVENLERHYSKVLAETKLDEIVYRSEIWLTSHRSLALLSVPLLLMVMPVGWAIALGIFVFLFWKLLAPALGNHTLARVFEWVGWEPAQVLLYVAALSLFGAWGEYDRLIAGVGWFIAIRWRLLDVVLRPVADLVFTRLYPMPVQDQTLRAVIISEAIRVGVPLDGFPSISKWLDDERVKEG
jgi:hypothetical protein